MVEGPGPGGTAPTVDSRGLHLLLDLYDCDVERLRDPEALEATLLEAADAVGATVVARVVHRFVPQGITAVLVVEESHLSIHSWPEVAYASFDFFTCGGLDPLPAAAVVERSLGAGRSRSLTVRRGGGRPPRVVRPGSSRSAS